MLSSQPIRSFLGVILLLLIPLTAFTQNVGIAFIHGTSDHRQDADTEYWKPDFVNELKNGLPNPENYFIVACDFTHYMWDEETAGCAANQLLSFIENNAITNLTIYTHSNGGNVMRWILSHPTYDLRYLRLTETITQVIAIAPSSGGTPLADEVINGNSLLGSLGWIYGYANDSVKQQRVGDMAIYNDQILLGTAGRPSLPVPFRTVVGTDVTASPFNDASYCNGYFYNSGLKITQTYLDYCSDGFLDCSSQSAAGQVWFFDVQKTTDQLPLSHNQSRHSCNGLGDILRNDLQGVTL